MELRFRTEQLADGRVRVDTITNPLPWHVGTWEHFGTFDSLAEAAVVCGDEVILQHQRAAEDDDPAPAASPDEETATPDATQEPAPPNPESLVDAILNTTQPNPTETEEHTPMTDEPTTDQSFGRITLSMFHGSKTWEFDATDVDRILEQYKDISTESLHDEAGDIASEVFDPTLIGSRIGLILLLDDWKRSSERGAYHFKVTARRDYEEAPDNWEWQDYEPPTIEREFVIHANTAEEAERLAWQDAEPPHEFEIDELYESDFEWLEELP